MPVRAGLWWVHGEPGVGKTALLEWLAGQASGCRVTSIAGVQSEMELAFAGLHQLCAPMLDRLEALPVPQREAVRTAFGMNSGQVPDRFLVGLAVLGLLSEVAADRPLVCLVDDVQWLDRASTQVLAFVARRLGAESVGLVFGAQVPGADLVGLPDLVVRGLRDGDARALVESVLAGPIDARVRDQIVAETRGNPLALLELPRGLTPAQLAGGFGLPGALLLPGRIEESFRRRLDVLPVETRRLLLLAAADPTGDPVLVWRAAGLLGIGAPAARPAVEAGLVDFGARVRFRHPLVRSAAYRSASLPQKQQAHAALAEATDAQADPDRRAWHRAAAAASPDEQVATELDRSAGRAQARGGLAAAAFLQRAAALTADPARRAGRTLAAAQASLQAGAFDQALGLLATAGAGSLDEFASAQAELLRGQIAFASGLGNDAPPLLLKAAKRLERLNLDLARETYLDAWYAAMFAGHLVGAGDLLEVSRAARALPAAARPPRLVDLLVDGLALLVTDGPAAAAPALRQARSAFASADIPAEQLLRCGWLTREADYALWDDGGWRATARQVQLAREVGALDQLPFLLNRMAMDAVWSGDFAAATSLIAQADAVREATGSCLAPYPAMMLASFRGSQAEAAPLIQATIEEATAGGQGAAVTWAHWVAAVLCNGLGHYDQALAAARQASEHRHPHISVWALPELIEAATRTGSTHLTGDALDLLAETTRAGGTDLGLGIEAREQLRTAHGMLDAMGMEAFAARARHELRATGENAPKHTVATMVELTAQEAQIARLARDGLSNPQIAARLFLSPRTVQYHLGKVFTKLGISSRSHLRRVLPASPDPALLR